MAAGGRRPRAARVSSQARLEGEPLAWITGSTRFCGLRDPRRPRCLRPALGRASRSRVAPSPRPRTHGVAIDLCTGSGADGEDLGRQPPRCPVVASDIDERAVACAAERRRRCTRVTCSTRFPACSRAAPMSSSVSSPTCRRPLWRCWHATPSGSNRRFSYDGGPDGTNVLRRVLHRPAFLAAGRPPARARRRAGGRARRRARRARHTGARRPS